MWSASDVALTELSYKSPQNRGAAKVVYLSCSSTRSWILALVERGWGEMDHLLVDAAVEVPAVVRIGGEAHGGNRLRRRRTEVPDVDGATNVLARIVDAKAKT